MAISEKKFSNLQGTVNKLENEVKELKSLLLEVRAKYPELKQYDEVEQEKKEESPKTLNKILKNLNNTIEPEE